MASIIKKRGGKSTPSVVKQNKNINNGNENVSKSNEINCDVSLDTDAEQFGIVDSTSTPISNRQQQRSMTPSFIDQSVLYTTACEEVEVNEKQTLSIGTLEKSNFEKFIRNESKLLCIKFLPLRYIFIALLGVILLITVFKVAYKILNITMIYEDFESLKNIVSYAETKLYEANVWSQENNLSAVLIPIICGLGLTIFSFIFIYFDSSIPGVNPPTPFSPRKNAIYQRHKSSSIHVGYMTSIVAGIVVSALMYCKFET